MVRTLSLSLLLALSALGAATGPARAQPGADRLLQAWLRDQYDEGREVERFAFREASAYVIDGPFGEWHVEQVIRTTGRPGDDRWEHTYESVRLNGRAVAPERWERQAHRRGAPADVPLERIMRALHLRRRLFNRLRPVGAATADDVDGRGAWRLELVGRGDEGPVERMTLWFDRDAVRLLRARAVLRRQADDAPFVVTTDYARVSGLDVPRARHVEGTIQRRRRGRVFTMLFTYDGTFTDYRIDD